MAHNRSVVRWEGVVLMCTYVLTVVLLGGTSSS
jgi:hypothetical protein